MLLKAITIGYKYKKMVESGTTITEISKQENKQETYIGRMVKLGYLSPKIIESVFRAEHYENLTVIALEGISSSSMDWKVQEGEFSEYR